jgi:hypothetical protein
VIARPYNAAANKGQDDGDERQNLPGHGYTSRLTPLVKSERILAR